MIKFNLAGNTEDFDFDVKKLIKSILATVSKKLKIEDKHVASYIFVDLKTIHNINLQYRKIDRPTDVISFAYIDDHMENEDEVVMFGLQDEILNELEILR